MIIAGRILLVELSVFLLFGFAEFLIKSFPMEETGVRLFFFMLHDIGTSPPCTHLWSPLFCDHDEIAFGLGLSIDGSSQRRSPLSFSRNSHWFFLPVPRAGAEVFFLLLVCRAPSFHGVGSRFHFQGDRCSIFSPFDPHLCFLVISFVVERETPPPGTRHGSSSPFSLFRL